MPIRYVLLGLAMLGGVLFFAVIIHLVKHAGSTHALCLAS